jgi:hypothetical protein
MFRQTFKSRLRAILAAACGVVCANSYAQSPLLDEVHTLAAANEAVPVEHSFHIDVAGTYQVTLVDEGAALTPSAPLTKLELALTTGSTIVGTPLLAAGSLQFNASVGTYVIHVVGTPGAVPGWGLIGIQVTGAPPNTPIASFSDTLAPPATTLPSNEVVIDDSFSVTSSGSYLVALTDLQLPQPLTTLTMLIAAPDGTIVTNPPLGTAGTATVSLQPGTYRIFAIGQSDPTVDAGLYSASVSPAGGGDPIYTKVIPVGTVASVANAPLAAGTAYTLQLADLAYPSPLTQLTAAVVANGQAVTKLTAAGSSPPFTAASVTYQVFALAGTAATGSYAITLGPQNGPAALSVARAVSVPGGAVSAYSFDTTVLTAGAYAFNVADFGLPSPLAALNGAAVQSGVVLGTPLKSAGTENVTAAVGPVSLLVFAQAAAAGGLLDVGLTPGAGGNPVLDVTQGVGQLFYSRQLSITSAASYAVSVSDLAFPDSFSTFAAIVTRGSSQIGSIIGGGAFSFTATPGNYFINFIAQPGGSQGAGTYAMTAAAAPIVTLQSSASSVASGGTVNLTWTTQNATACTGSGGWSGTQLANGSATSAALTSSTTFTLTCTGTGVSVAQSVTVAIATPAKSGGGGGKLGTALLFALAAVLMARLVQAGGLIRTSLNNPTRTAPV